MYRGLIYGRDLLMSGSPYALLAFKREFGESLPVIAHNVRKRFAETGEIDVISLLGICWAMCKSYDDYGTPGFEQWFAEFGFDDDEIPDDIGEAIIAFDQIWNAVEQELFVTNRPTSAEPSGDDGDEHNELADWVEWSNILSLIQLGFSMDDIKHMPMSDFIAYTDLMALASESQRRESEPQVIEADQAVIDSFFF